MADPSRAGPSVPPKIDTRLLDVLNLTVEGLSLLSRMLEADGASIAVADHEAEQAMRLAHLGLVTQGSGQHFRLSAPRHALRSYIDQVRSQADAAQALGRWFADHHAVAPSADVEQVIGAEAVNAVFRKIQDDARTVVRALSIGSSQTGDPVNVAPGTL